MPPTHQAQGSRGFQETAVQLEEEHERVLVLRIAQSFPQAVGQVVLRPLDIRGKQRGGPLWAQNSAEQALEAGPGIEVSSGHGQPSPRRRTGSFPHPFRHGTTSARSLGQRHATMMLLIPPPAAAASMSLYLGLPDKTSLQGCDTSPKRQREGTLRFPLVGASGLWRSILMSPSALERARRPGFLSLTSGSTAVSMPARDFPRRTRP